MHKKISNKENLSAMDDSNLVPAESDSAEQSCSVFIIGENDESRYFLSNSVKVENLFHVSYKLLFIFIHRMECQNCRK